jgi:AraC-like DNA-binding protein
MTQHVHITQTALPDGLLAAQACRLLDEVRGFLDHDLDAARQGMSRLSELLTVRPVQTPSPEPARGGLAPWQRQRVARHIEENLEGPVHLEAMAAVAARSVCYFSRAFKVTFGETPHAYVMRRRVRRAQDLMLTSDEPLSHIALACGFADQAHLSRLFRREVGQTPSAWRRAAEPRMAA